MRLQHEHCTRARALYTWRFLRSGPSFVKACVSGAVCVLSCTVEGSWAAFAWTLFSLHLFCSSFLNRTNARCEACAKGYFSPNSDLSESCLSCNDIENQCVRLTHYPIPSVPFRRCLRTVRSIGAALFARNHCNHCPQRTLAALQLIRFFDLLGVNLYSVLLVRARQTVRLNERGGRSRRAFCRRYADRMNQTTCVSCPPNT